MAAKTLTIPVWAQELFAKMSKLLEQINRATDQLAALYVQGIDRDPEFTRWLRQLAPSITGDYLIRLEKIGRGLADPRVATCAHADKMARLPLDLQVALLNGERIRVVRNNRSINNLLYSELNNLDASRVFAGDRLKTVSEQKAHLDALARRDQEAVDGTPTNLRADQIAPLPEQGKVLLKVDGPVFVTRTQLRQMLEMVGA